MAEILLASVLPLKADPSLGTDHTLTAIGALMPGPARVLTLPLTVPGGLGAVTTELLLRNVLTAAEQLRPD